MLNSDNINISAESFDYGPWRFAPEWDEGFTAAYFDHAGLYAFGRQPEAIQWDVAQLAGCLTLIADAPALSDVLATWAARFEAVLFGKLLARLGIASSGEADRELVSALLGALRSRAIGIDRLFFDWRGGRVPADPVYSAAPFERLKTALAGRGRPLTHPYWSEPAPCTMLIDEVEAIWAAIADRDDWSPFDAKIAAVRRFGDAMTADAA